MKDQNSKEKWSGFAIGSIIFAIWFAPLGLIFGIIALTQMKKYPNTYPQKGKGLAIAGIVISSVFIFFALFLTLLGLLFGAAESTPTSDLAASETPTVVREDGRMSITYKAEPVYKVGDEIVAGDFKWKVTSIEKRFVLGNSEYLKKKASGMFLLVKVEVENVGNEPQLLSDTFLKLVDDKGRTFAADTGAGLYLGEEWIFFKTLNPGVTLRGTIVYDVPKDMTVANLKISSNFAENSITTVKMLI